MNQNTQLIATGRSILLILLECSNTLYFGFILSATMLYEVFSQCID